MATNHKQSWQWHFWHFTLLWHANTSLSTCHAYLCLSLSSLFLSRLQAGPDKPCPDVRLLWCLSRLILCTELGGGICVVPLGIKYSSQAIKKSKHFMPEDLDAKPKKKQWLIWWGLDIYVDHVTAISNAKTFGMPNSLRKCHSKASVVWGQYRAWQPQLVRRARLILWLLLEGKARIWKPEVGGTFIWVRQGSGVN